VSRLPLVLLGILLLAACGKQDIAGPTPPPVDQPDKPPPPGNRPPTAHIGAPPSLIGPEGSVIPFDADRSSDPDGDTLRFFWDFGDGATQLTADRTVGHMYRNNGSYPVTLVVSDPHGLADTASMMITVANVEPQITAFNFPDTVVAGTYVEIEIQYSDPGVDDTVRVSFWVGSSGGGEGTGLPGPGIVLKYFSAPGTYHLSLIAEDNDGAIVAYNADHPLVVIPSTAAGTVAIARRP
jgi:hypothetical protein